MTVEEILDKYVAVTIVKVEVTKIKWVIVDNKPVEEPYPTYYYKVAPRNCEPMLANTLEEALDMVK